MAHPFVTVLVDTYNHERFIEEALVSVIEQDFAAAEMEILVVDDGSTDRTPEIVRKFAPRVQLRRKHNGGQASAFNFGIPEARGEIVAFLDGDDWWARNKLTRVAETMAADPSLGIVGHGIITVHRDGSRQTEILREGFRFRANTVEGAKLFRRRKSLLGTSRMTIRRDILCQIGSIPEEIRVQADEYLFTIGAVLANAQILREALTFYRMHESNGFQISTTDTERSRQRADVLSDLWVALAGALKRVPIEPEARDALLGLVQAEAAQARLTLDGGWPWETVSTEWTLYRVLRPAAPTPHRLFKVLTLFAALALPPKCFYKWRAQAASTRAYERFRHTFFPAERPKHVEHTAYTGSLRP